MMAHMRLQRTAAHVVDPGNNSTPSAAAASETTTEITVGYWDIRVSTERQAKGSQVGDTLSGLHPPALG